MRVFRKMKMKIIFKLGVLLGCAYVGYICLITVRTNTSDPDKSDNLNTINDVLPQPYKVSSNSNNEAQEMKPTQQVHKKINTENSRNQHILQKLQTPFGVENKTVKDSEGSEIFRNELLNVVNPFDIKTPPSYLPNYRNPCWLDENHVLRCLPYCLLIGMMKCGTTDLYQRLMVHPRLIPPNSRRWEVEPARLRLDSQEARWKMERWLYKEPHFWAGHWRRNKTVSEYVSLFDGAADVINTSLMRNYKTGEMYHATVTFEASTTTFWDNSDWELNPDNAGLQEPRYLNPHYVHHLLPNVKLLLILRNPIDRLFSEFKRRPDLKSMKNVQHENLTVAFHNKASVEIQDWTKCVQEKSFKRCLHSPYKMENIIRRGMYAYYLQDWLDVFPREQIAVIKFEEYISNPLDKLKRIYSFLELDALPVQLEDHVRNYDAENAGENRAPMLEETRKLLSEFYAPYNKQLASMLKDDRFLWKDT